VRVLTPYGQAVGRSACSPLLTNKMSRSLSPALKKKNIVEVPSRRRRQSRLLSACAGAADGATPSLISIHTTFTVTPSLFSRKSRSIRKRLVRIKCTVHTRVIRGRVLAKFGQVRRSKTSFPRSRSLWLSVAHPLPELRSAGIGSPSASVVCVAAGRDRTARTHSRLSTAIPAVCWATDEASRCQSRVVISTLSPVPLVAGSKSIGWPTSDKVSLSSLLRRPTMAMPAIRL